MKRVTVLGSTGSIGRNTIEVIARSPDRYRVIGLAARHNTGLLEEQIRLCRPEVVAVFEGSAAERLRKKNLQVEIVTGEKGLTEVAGLDQADIVVSAIAGSDGLMPTLTAVRKGKNVALATKESLVMAGSIIMSEAKKKGVSVIPVDSEHSAIFQCLDGRKAYEIRKIILTASGGPFLGKDISELRAVTPEKALKHPTWDMGRKISVDSATLMNKGLEVIEARWLFDVTVDRIEVLIHPQSIVHSMVELIDGSVLAQMSVPDMKGPISYALSYPQRMSDVIPHLDLVKVRELTFEPPDLSTYRCLALTYDALRTGGTMPAVLNAANEIAVESFLGGDLPFTGIPVVVSETMERHVVSDGATLEGIVDASMWAKRKAREVVEGLHRS